MHGGLVGRVFGDAAATATLLGEIASSLITVTSITFSLLLLAVQQSAGALGSQVFDQFLRRRLNQTFFGFFVGLSLYALVVLATVRTSFNPVFGATVALALSIVALYGLILLIYNTINQARPAVIIKAIHDHTLLARECQLLLLRQTRRSPCLDATSAAPVRADEDGFVTGIDLEGIRAATGALRQEVEVVLLVACHG